MRAATGSHMSHVKCTPCVLNACLHWTRTQQTPYRLLHKRLNHKSALPKYCRFVCSVAAASSQVPAAASVTSNSRETPTKPCQGFLELGVDKKLVPQLQQLQIQQPSPIQSSAIPPILNRKDCAVQSYTGSGKTLAYLLPALTQVLQSDLSKKPSDRNVQVLVVAPSQELCMQIVNVAKEVGGEALQGHLQQCIGGANMARQVEALKKRRPSVVVGTPGRVAQLGRMGKLGVHNVRTLIVDEVDQLLSDSFMEDMRWIIEHTGKRSDTARQTVLVSATLTPSVMARTYGWCQSPQYISAGPAPALEPEPLREGASDKKGPQKPTFGWGNQGWDGAESEFVEKTKGAAGGVEDKELVPAMPPSLRHFYVVAPRARKVDTLRRCVHALGIQKALVFHNFQQRVQDTLFKLEANSLDVGMLHGELSKMQRAKVLRDFKSGTLRALVVSDVVARGLDVPACDAVFHAELASSASHYAHRAGRTGRMGAEGTVITLVEPGEKWVVQKLAKKLNIPILEAHVSHGKLIPGPDPNAPQPVAKKTKPAKDADKRDSEDADNAKTAKSRRSQNDADLSSKQKTKLTGSSERKEPRADAVKERSGAEASASSSSIRRSAAAAGNRKPAVEEDEDFLNMDDDEEFTSSSGTGSGARQLHPQQKQKFDKILQQAGLSLSQLEEFNKDEDEEDDDEVEDEVPAVSRKRPATRGTGPKNSALPNRMKGDLAAELEELRAERLSRKQKMPTGRSAARKPPGAMRSMR